jgi:hypothetical protein
MPGRRRRLQRFLLKHRAKREGSEAAECVAQELTPVPSDANVFRHG